MVAPIFCQLLLTNTKYRLQKAKKIKYTEGYDEVFIGRIRRDYSVKSGINLWVVADNVRKGAATNAIQIMEEMMNKNSK